MMENKFRILPVGHGFYTVEFLKKFLWFKRWRKFILLDIHSGHGGREIHWMKGSKEDCEKVIRFLKLRKRRFSSLIDWKLMEVIERKLGIKYYYYD